MVELLGSYLNQLDIQYDVVDESGSVVDIDYNGHIVNYPYRHKITTSIPNLYVVYVPDKMGFVDILSNGLPMYMDAYETARYIGSIMYPDIDVEDIEAKLNVTLKEENASASSLGVMPTGKREGGVYKEDPSNKDDGGMKSEGKFTEIKAAIKSAWSLAKVKGFRLEFQESDERLDIYPVAVGDEEIIVNWGVLPKYKSIVLYTTNFNTGDSEVEGEIYYNDLDDVEDIFADLFTSMYLWQSEDAKTDDIT